MTNPAPINRPLTDNERDLMIRLGVFTVSDETRCTPDTAASILDQLAGEGELILYGDNTNAYLDACGKAIVHATREWLAFHAEHPDAIDWTRHRRIIPDAEREDTE